MLTPASRVSPFRGLLIANRSLILVIRSTEIVEARGSILFRNVKIEPAEKGRSLNSSPTWPSELTSDWPLIENRKIAGLIPELHPLCFGLCMFSLIRHRDTRKTTH